VNSPASRRGIDDILHLLLRGGGILAPQGIHHGIDGAGGPHTLHDLPRRVSIYWPYTSEPCGIRSSITQYEKRIMTLSKTSKKVPVGARKWPNLVSRPPPQGLILRVAQNGHSQKFASRSSLDSVSPLWMPRRGTRRTSISPPGSRSTELRIYIPSAAMYNAAMYTEVRFR
jgi:hypothetical protein